jgi:HEAT repeat protein
LAASLSGTLAVACGDKVAGLTSELSGGNDKQCESAAKALGALGSQAASAAPAMFDVVVKQRKAPGTTCWMTVVAELPKLGPAATSLLLTALGDHRAEDAGHVLASMGASGVTTLSTALADPKKADGAAEAIAFLGRPGAPALGALRDAHKGGRLTEKKFLATISWFKSVDTVPDFAAALRSKDVEVRWMATRALADFVTTSPDAVKALALALEDDSAEIRNHAVAALSKGGPAASPALPEIRRAAERRLISSGMARLAIARIQPR